MRNGILLALASAVLFGASTPFAKLDFIENLTRSAAEVAVKDWFSAEHFVGPLEGEPELSEVTERAPTAPHVGPVEQLEAI
jgi:hypothetical protein